LSQTGFIIEERPGRRTKQEGVHMVKRPDGMNAFEFSVLSGLRAAQLIGGCAPRVERSGKLTVTAQHEIAARKVVRSPSLPDGGSSGPAVE
jgi:hypothetical protein